MLALKISRSTYANAPAVAVCYFTVCLSVCLSLCSFPLNPRGLKSHDHETWHVGPLSDLDVHQPSGILIFGRIAPQAHAAWFFCFRLISEI